ncbi:ankyrin repeat domain-containing protein [Salinisphaera aquimarina]|uniref:Ankyrin repeat domain-containing protein n=1 Tax=Salinisphaera aquimarina TaxID=2094031 RepID=A0ABV7ETC9_9GAMM
MKFLLAAILIAGAAALGVLALDPTMDAACAASRIRDRVGDRHHDWQCIHYAAARGSVSAVEAALANGVSKNLRTRRGQTPLILAAENGRLDIVRRLIQADAQLEARDGRNGFTALHWAAERYRPAIARALIAAGAAVNAENKWNQTPLWQASWQADQGNTEIAHILVSGGADIHRADEHGNTPLLMAARAGHRPMVDYLLTLGADIEARNDHGRTPLYQAVAGGHADCVRLLLARGADPNRSAAGIAPLQLALDKSEREIADLLQANGATDYSRYAAMAAMKHGRMAYTDGDYPGAIRAFGAAITMQPQLADAYYRRGLAFKASGALSDARADLSEALALDAGNNDAREALARLYVDTGDYQRALAPLGRLLDDQPDNARALYLLGESRHGLGDVSSASDYFSQACGLGFKPACSR